MKLQRFLTYVVIAGSLGSAIFAALDQRWSEFFAWSATVMISLYASWLETQLVTLADVVANLMNSKKETHSKE